MDTDAQCDPDAYRLSATAAFSSVGLILGTP
jgi:hypothetical protein